MGYSAGDAARKKLSHTTGTTNVAGMNNVTGKTYGSFVARVRKLVAATAAYSSPRHNAAGHTKLERPAGIQNAHFYFGHELGRVAAEGPSWWVGE